MTNAPNRAVPVAQAANGVGIVSVPGWKTIDWLWHGFSTHGGGVSRAYLPARDLQNPWEGQLNLGFTPDDAGENVRQNRLRWVQAVTGSRETPLRTIRQIHSAIAVTATEAAPDPVPEADGIVTRVPGILLAVMTADCIPVLILDPGKRAVGAFHAGWRGTVAGIVQTGVARMKTEFGSDPAQLLAAIGPGIGACCYAVGPEVRSQFEAQFAYATCLFVPHGDSVRLDLTEANRRQLLAAGLAPASISLVGGCTACQPELFYSHRASGGQAGRMMASIGIRPA